MQQSPFVTKKKKDDKKHPRIRQGVIEQFVGLGSDIGHGVAQVPRDIATGIPKSVGLGEPQKQSGMSPEAHSKNVTDALYEGQSLTPEQRAQLAAQDKQSSDQEIAKQRALLQSFINRRKSFEETPKQKEPDVFEQQQKEEEEKRRLEEMQKQQMSAPVLPSSGVSKQPGLRKKVKQQQKGMETKMNWKGGG